MFDKKLKYVKFHSIAFLCKTNLTIKPHNFYMQLLIKKISKLARWIIRDPSRGPCLARVIVLVGIRETFYLQLMTGWECNGWSLVD